MPVVTRTRRRPRALILAAFAASVFSLPLVFAPAALAAGQAQQPSAPPAANGQPSRFVTREELDRALAPGRFATKAEVNELRAQLETLRARLNGLKAQMADVKTRLDGAEQTLSGARGGGAR